MAKLPLAALSGAKDGDARAGRRLLGELAHRVRTDTLSDDERTLLADMLDRMAAGEKAHKAAADPAAAKRKQGGRPAGYSADYYGIVQRLRMLAFARTQGASLKITAADKRALIAERGEKGLEPKTVDRAIKWVEEAEAAACEASES